MSTDGSARACGVGVCPRLVPTLGGPGEVSGPRTDGFHWLGTLGRPRATGARRPHRARGREDLYGSRRWRACGETYYRSRRRCPILDHDACGIPLARPRPRLIAHREPPNHRFHPRVLAVSVSLDRERPERPSNQLARTYVRVLQQMRRSTFLGTYHKLSGHKRESARTFIS